MTESTVPSSAFRRFVHARTRLLIALAAGLVLYLVLPQDMRFATRTLLAWDLTVGHGPKGNKQGVYVVGTIGLLALFVYSFRLPVDVAFTGALVQDTFSLFVKQDICSHGTTRDCPDMTVSLEVLR